MTEMPSKPDLGALTWLVIIAGTSVILFVFQKVLWLVVPTLLALALYYCLRPLVRGMVRLGLSHRMATRAIAALLFLATVLVVIFLFPIATARAAGWKATMTHYLQGGLDFLVKTEELVSQKVPALRESSFIRSAPRDVDMITQQFGEKYLGTLLWQMVHWLPSLLLMPYLTYFMLQEGNRFKKHLIRSVPNAFFEKTLLLFDRIDHSLHNFFVGLIKLTFLDTVCLALGLWIFGVSSPLLLGLVAAVLAWIPYIGSAAGCLLVVLVAATDFPFQPTITYSCIFLFLAVRILDDFFFLPMTIGRSLQIHPVLSVLMLFLGASVAGPTGLVLVLPVMGVVAVVVETLGQILADQRLKTRFRQARQLKMAELKLLGP